MHGWCILATKYGIQSMITAMITGMQYRKGSKIVYGSFHLVQVKKHIKTTWTDHKSSGHSSGQCTSGLGSLGALPEDFGMISPKLLDQVYPPVIDIEHGHLKWAFTLEIVMFHYSYVSLPGGHLINDHWTWVNRWFFRTFAIHITHSQGRILPRTLINLNTWDVASAYVKKHWETAKIIHNPFEKSKNKITQQLKNNPRCFPKIGTKVAFRVPGPFPACN